MSEDTVREPEKSPFVDRQAVLRALKQLNEEIGFVPVPGATAEHARELMAAQGIRPEENLFSREMIALRYPGEEVEE